MPRRAQTRHLYERVAASLRAKIVRGDLPPGGALQSQSYLAHEYDVSQDTVRKALAALRAEGLIETSRGEATRVRARPTREPVWLRPGETAVVRMPSLSECDEYGVGSGVPVFTVDDAIFPADRFELFAR